MRVLKALCSLAAMCALPLGGASVRAADAAQLIQGQWRHPESSCEEASVTITVDGDRIAFRWMAEGQPEREVEIERIESVTRSVVQTTILEAFGEDQEDRPGDRYRYVVDGDRLVIESLSGAGSQLVLRCAASV